jgi:two-component system, sensor histidine kinase and response regulator
VDSVVSEVAVDQARRSHRAVDLQMDLQHGAVWLGTVYLAKLIKEIVNNAFKFSQLGQAVRVIGRPQSTHYNLTVEDGGRGMTPEQIDSIGANLQFERRRHEQQGQGLGLIIAKWIAELHGAS